MDSNNFDLSKDPDEILPRAEVLDEQARNSVERVMDDLGDCSGNDIVDELRRRNVKAYRSTIRRMMRSRQHAFYWQWLSGVKLQPVVDEYAECMVSIRYDENAMTYEVVMGPSFWRLDAASRMAILEQEVLHRALRHQRRVKGLPDEDLAAIASDLSINTLFPDGYMNLEFDDGTEVASPSPSTFNMEDGRTLDEYYTALWREQNKDNQPPQGQQGGGGSAAAAMHAWQRPQEQSQSLSQMIQDASGSAPTNLPQASGGGGDAGEDGVARQRMEESEAGIGNLPGDIKLAVEAAKEVKKPYWALGLRTKIQDDVRREGRWRLSYKRANRRDDTNELPGRRRKSMPKVAVAIDTSGSMSDEVLQEIVRSLPHLDRQARIGHCIQCDTVIHSVDKYVPKDMDEIMGRGGTSFHPPIEWLSNDLRGKRYNYLFYFTDGQGYWPEASEVRDDLEIVWVITDPIDRLSSHPPVGRVIQMTDLQGKRLEARGW